MKRPNLKKKIRACVDFDTQREFAYSIDMSHTVLSSIISGRTVPYPIEIESIARGLGCDISDVVSDWNE